jgi:rhodanese-related sulfurtransferase
MKINESLQAGKGTIVDVRSAEEFRMGHVRGSINIPLQEVGARIAEFKKMEAPLILCCASGNRSGIATMMLQREGLDCTNGGGWMDVDYQLNMVKAS